MSDIVKRLRVRRNPMLDGEREEAAEEIERLRQETLVQSEYIETLRGLVMEVMSTRPHDPSRPYEVFTADISWKPRAAKACGVEVLEKTEFVCSGMVIKDDEDGAA